MANEAETVCREAVTRPLAPHVRYDAKCLEWDSLLALGEYPTDAAQRMPAQWQLVYELRPLELIPYWLGIPFKPCHPIYAVIYDQDAPGYYTAPASKVSELGRQRWVPWAIPLSRLLEGSAQVDNVLKVLADYAQAGIQAAIRTLSRMAEDVSAARWLRSKARQ